jgi:hypothetical protein
MGVRGVVGRLPSEVEERLERGRLTVVGDAALWVGDVGVVFGSFALEDQASRLGSQLTARPSFL